VVPSCSRRGQCSCSIQLGLMLFQWVTVLPRMQSRQYRGTGVQLRGAMERHKHKLGLVQADPTGSTG